MHEARLILLFKYRVRALCLVSALVQLAVVTITPDVLRHSSLANRRPDMGSLGGAELEAAPMHVTVSVHRTPARINRRVVTSSF